jgi:serine/threonine protein kinase
MSISEAQKHFNAYGSGQLPEFELRSFIRSSLRRKPELSSAFIALTDAYCRANLIDDTLHTTINSDIVEVTAPMNQPMSRPSAAGFPTMIRTPAGQRCNADWMDAPAANSASVNKIAAVTGRSTPSNWDSCAELLEPGAPLYPGSIIRERFVLVEELGRGGMGVVYKAFDRSRGDMKDRYVAIKVLNEEFKRHPMAVRALQREARKAQKLAHPNIVAVHDFDHDGGNVYMVMEYLCGRSLDQVMKEDGQGGIPPEPALKIIGCLASALSYAHTQEIVHCDFKPSNAFLCQDGKVKVLDFGIARATPTLKEKDDTTLFDAGQLGAISPAYASFELLQREKPDVRDDIYSFSCVAYELLTGLHPFQRLDAVKAFQMGLKPRPVRRLSRGQWRALKQGLAFRGADRQPSIDVLARELTLPQKRTKLWLTLGSAATIAVAAGVVAWQWPDKWIAVVHSHAPREQHDNTRVAEARPTPTLTTEQPAAPIEIPSTAVPQVDSTQAKDLPPLVAVDPSANTDHEVAAKAERSAPATAPVPGTEEKRAAFAMLREQFETQALAGDTAGALNLAKALKRASPGSNYVAQDVPRILGLSYVHLAKTQFAGGQVIESLQTIADARTKYPKSVELRNLDVRYISAANVYDRLRYAVALNADDMQHYLNDLQTAEGDEYDTAAQMLAQTLADRIADQRAADRTAVADKLLETGKQLFPNYVGILGRGRAGALPDAPLTVGNP